MAIFIISFIIEVLILVLTVILAVIFGIRAWLKKRKEQKEKEKEEKEKKKAGSKYFGAIWVLAAAETGPVPKRNRIKKRKPKREIGDEVAEKQ